jgi:hypothetical protein
MMHPLSVQIITRDNRLQKEIHQTYEASSRFPRWELVKIFFRAFMNLKYH